MYRFQVEPVAPLEGKFFYLNGATYEGQYAFKPKIDENGEPIPIMEGDPPPPKIRQVNILLHCLASLHAKLKNNDIRAHHVCRIMKI